MKVLIGRNVVDRAALERAGQAIKTAKVEQQAAIDQLEASVTREVGGKTVDSAALLKEDAAQGGGKVDWSKFPSVLNASEAQLDAAWKQLDALWSAQETLSAILVRVGGLEEHVVPRLSPSQVDEERYRRAGLLDLVTKLEKALEAAGPLPAAQDFPRSELRKLRRELDIDLDLLRSAEPGAQKPSWFGGGWGFGMKKDPSADQLPATKAVTLAEGHDPKVLLKTLKAPELAPKIEAARAKAADRPTFDRWLAAFAVLADEAMHAPDYANNPMSSGPDHRQAYRARQHHRGEVGRHEQSRRSLVENLSQALSAPDPVAVLGDKLVERFLVEVGIERRHSAAWAPKPEAVEAALKGEAFLPLRAINERSHHWARYLPAETVKGVVRELTQSVVEGRFEEWRLGNRASREQLACLTAAQREAFLAPVSVEHETKDTKGNSVKLTTQEPQASDFSLMWATKVGGPSHGFDTMTNCALSLLTNARNQAVVVEDPRWPNHAGRTYLRLIQDAATDKPVLLMESAHRDFPYPGDKGALEEALIKHALAKAKAMGVPLAISEGATSSIQSLGLKGNWENRNYSLAPALLLEAASIFGPHDWPQQEREVRGMRKMQFYAEI